MINNRIKHDFGIGTICRDIGDFYEIEWDKVPMLEQNGCNKKSLVLKKSVKFIMDIEEEISLDYSGWDLGNVEDMSILTVACFNNETKEYDYKKTLEFYHDEISKAFKLPKELLFPRD